MFKLEGSRKRGTAQALAEPDFVDSADIADDGLCDLVPIGRTDSGWTVRLDLSDDAHVLVTAGAGRGKTTLLTGVGAWLSFCGTAVEVCDSCRVSFDGSLAGLPGVTIHRDVNEQMAAIGQVRAEMEERYAALSEGSDWVPRVLLIDELGSLLALSRNVAAFRRSEAADRMRDDLTAILVMGRAVRCHVVAASARPWGRLVEHFPARVAIGPQTVATRRLLFGTESSSPWFPNVKGPRSASHTRRDVSEGNPGRLRLRAVGPRVRPHRGGSSPSTRIWRGEAAMKIGPFTVTPRCRRRRSVAVGPVRVRYPYAVRRLMDVGDLLSPPDRRRTTGKRR